LRIRARRAHALRLHHLPPLRGRSHPRLLRENESAPPQPPRRPSRQHSPTSHRPQPHATRTPHQRIRRPPTQRRQKHQRNHALPQTSHRPRNLPSTHQQPRHHHRHRPTRTTPNPTHHPQTSRPSPRNLAQPHLRHRTPQAPTTRTHTPIPKMAHHHLTQNRSIGSRSGV